MPRCRNARQAGRHRQTLQGETLTLAREAEQALLFEAVERGLQLGNAAALAFAKRGEVGLATVAGTAKHQKKEGLGKRHLHVCSVPKH